MPEQATSTPAPVYDNNGQYSRSGILRYEKIFGAGYISTGGPETTDYLCEKIRQKLSPGVRVLDVGSGIGGAAFHLAEKYGARVTGIDLAPEMVAIAHERAQEASNATNVRFLLDDVMKLPADEKFDIIWSRDALMHLHDKPALFSKLHELLAPGGQLVITDYARGISQRSPEFRSYIKSTGYHVTDPASYGTLLEGAGFVNVVVEDATERFIDILEREAARLAANRDDFLQMFSEQDLNYLTERWAMKVRFCRAGDMKWGIFHAQRGA
jgi:phosphoethanolamine N-methyltransferase